MALTVLALAAIVLLAPRADAYEQRSGSLMIGLHGQYGVIEGSGRFGDEFDWGPGYGVRLRYALSRHSAIGLVFERLSFDSVFDTVAAAGELEPPDRVVLIVTGAEYVRQFDRRGKLGKSALAGLGFYHPTIEIGENEAEVAGQEDNLLAWAGGALEYFPRRTIGVEFGLRLYGILADGGNSAVVEGSLGVNFYLLK
jgi:hypothetical protein